MRDVDANEAEQMLDQLLDEVERGGAVRILDADARRAEVAEPIEHLRALREQFGKAPLEHP